MGELEPTRENDARIAEAMGWERRPHPQGGTYWLDERGYAQTANALEYTTDPALVVPMMDRLGSWGYAVELVRRPIDGAWCAIAWWGEPYIVAPEPTGEAQAATANLAVASALLAVWNEVRP